VPECVAVSLSDVYICLDNQNFMLFVCLSTPRKRVFQSFSILTQSLFHGYLIPSSFYPRRQPCLSFGFATPLRLREKRDLPNMDSSIMEDPMSDIYDESDAFSPIAPIVS
jgi:hypothetical protein